jgi:PhnB protein
MATKVKPIPDGYHSLTPYLHQQDSAAAMEWYKRAFGAEELVRMPGPGGKGVMHAEMKIGDSIFMMADECPQMEGKSPKTAGTITASLLLYVNDVDSAVERAVKAGATLKMPPTNMFWGDRFAKLLDPFGHFWSVATHVEDVPPEEMPRRAKEAMEKMAK